MYSQAVKMTGTETILFIAGQVAYCPDGAPMHGDFKAQARAALQCLKEQSLYWRQVHLSDQLCAARARGS